MKTQLTRGAYAMQHVVDPGDALRAAVGDISAAKVMGPQILVATYVRPAKSAGGIYIPPVAQKEDIFQGKTGLVLAIGPTAFKESALVDFGGLHCSVGDWIIFDVHHGLQTNINAVHCRLIDDVQVRMIVPHPDFLQ